MRPIQPGKGQQGQICNLTTCSNNNAWWLGTATSSYYCAECAKNIFEASIGADRPSYLIGIPAIVPPKQATIDVGHSYDTIAVIEPFTSISVWLTLEAAVEEVKRVNLQRGLYEDGSLPEWYTTIDIQLREIGKLHSLSKV